MKILDTLRSLVTGLGGDKDKSIGLSFIMRQVSDAELNTMHRSDWLARKIVDIIPNDMTREWRAWQADGKQIQLIEKLEKSPLVNTQIKVNVAMRKARLLRGSAIYMGLKGANPEEPIEFDKIKQGDLQYLNVLNRRDVTAAEVIKDVTSEFYGEPEYYEVASPGQAGILRIHPSRMIRFIGAEVLDEDSNNDNWGDSILQLVYDAVQNAGSVQQHISSLVAEAKTDVIYIPQLSQFLRDPVTTRQLTDRFAYANQMKSMFNMVLLEGNGTDTGEKWEQKQINFGQLPELVQQFLQIAAGAADIPVTRLLGQSPSGLNATGDGDIRNYYDNVSARQRTELTPRLQRLDEVTIRSALGVRPEEIYYTWNPLWAVSQKEKADIFKVKVDGARVIAGSAVPLMPIDALSDALVNMLVEDGSMPGLEKAIAEYGALSEQDHPTEADIKTAMVPPKPAANEDKKIPPDKKVLPFKKKAANDAEPATLYVRRDVVNAAEITSWAKGQGMTDIEDDLHVTVVYSRAPFDWIKAGNAYYGGSEGKLELPAGGPRVVEPLGNMTAVLMFASSELSWRHEEIVRAGASHDYDSYQPHISLTKAEINLDDVEPYRGPIVLGPEIFEEFDTSYCDGGNPNHEPAGSPKGGQFARLNSTVVEGKRIIEGEVPPHIEALRIPPAWTDVVYDPNPNASLLVAGQDAKGRSVYIYSAKHASIQSAAKFARIQELDAKYDSVFSQNEKARANPETRDAADATRLIMETGIRPGSDKDTRSDFKAYGATTLEGRHVVGVGGLTYLRFVAGKKHGETVNLLVPAGATAKMLRDRKSKAGNSGRLFGELSDSDLRDHVNTFDGGSFTTKDFRTLLGTRTAMQQVAKQPRPSNPTAYKKAVKAVAKTVSDKLGNTPTVALQSYINPVVFAGWRLS